MTTFRTANRAVQFAHKPNHAQPPRFGSPHEPHRDATVRFMWGANRHGSSRFATVRETAAVLRHFSSFAIFFYALLTLAQQVSFPPSSANAQLFFADSCVAAAFRLAQLSRARHLQKDHIFTPSVFTHADPPPHSRVRSYFSTLRSFSVFDGRIFAVFAHSQNLTVLFWQLLLNCSIRQSHFSSVSSLPRRPSTTFSRSIAFLQLSLTQRIRRSCFGNFCSIAAFDSRILAAFLLPHAAPAPRSHIRSHSCSFCSLSAFDARVLAAFAKLQHLTVTF